MLCLLCFARSDVFLGSDKKPIHHRHSMQAGAASIKASTLRSQFKSKKFYCQSRELHAACAWFQRRLSSGIKKKDGWRCLKPVFGNSVSGMSSSQVREPQSRKNCKKAEFSELQWPHLRSPPVSSKKHFFFPSYNCLMMIYCELADFKFPRTCHGEIARKIFLGSLMEINYASLMTREFCW